MATPGASVKLKRLRQRYGINAPKLAIRTHADWYWHSLAVIVILSALAVWIYHAARSIAGFHNDGSGNSMFNDHLMELDTELTILHSLSFSG